MSLDSPTLVSLFIYEMGRIIGHVHRHRKHASGCLGWVRRVGEGKGAWRVTANGFRLGVMKVFWT